LNSPAAAIIRVNAYKLFQYVLNCGEILSVGLL
jgi:hypothetical protein